MNALLRRVLVLGSGGREHSLARAIARSPSAPEVIIAPGNGGTESSAEPQLRRAKVDLSDPNVIALLAERENVDLVVVGPEAPLCEGIVDVLTARGILAFGPTRAAARLEGSKSFLKEFAVRHAIPTARHRTVTSLEQARAEIDARGAPIVVKADGLCAGKGVVVAQSREEALEAAQAMLVDRAFGDAGSQVILEECLVGREVSVHAICDGERWLLLPPARDHKRIFDGDRGPNTGGMGVVCPASDVGPELLARIEREAIAPTLAGMRAEGHPFRGVLFAGIMITAEGVPMLLEHNVRFGDPECEALMELLEGDVAGLLASAARGALDPSLVRVRRDHHAVVVVLAANGYPNAPKTGAPITGLEDASATGAVVHHAGTRLGDHGLEVAGGRVLAVTASAQTFEEARVIAYQAADRIHFDGKQLRRDIGQTLPREAVLR